jgi:hypothetical protein
LPAGDEALEAVKIAWSRDRISQTGVVEGKDDARHVDSNLAANVGSGGSAEVDASAHLLRELELLSDASAAVSPPTDPPGNPPSADPPSVTPSVTRSKRMSSVSEQEHLNPRDPLYYAPRWLRERSAARGDGLQTSFSPASFDSQLESAVSDALRHPLDPELMNEPHLESKKALWTVAARFAAAIGVAALVALFFVVAVPGSRQGDGETSTSAFSNVTQSIKTTLFQSGEASPKPAISEFQALLAATPPSTPAAAEQDNQLLQQFMQWREKPDPAAPQRTTP